MEYNLKFLILGAPKTGKTTLISKLFGYLKFYESIQFEQYQWFLDGKVINGIIQDLQGIDLMSPVVIPFIKESAVLFICYDPERGETIDFLDSWLKEYFRYVPASSSIYLVSTKNKSLSSRISEIRRVYFCCKHVSVDLDNEKDVEKLFERAGKSILLYAQQAEKEHLPGFKKKKVRRGYCLWW